MVATRLVPVEKIYQLETYKPTDTAVETFNMDPTGRIPMTVPVTSVTWLRSYGISFMYELSL